jgi:hypothetical protein
VRLLLALRSTPSNHHLLALVQHVIFNKERFFILSQLWDTPSKGFLPNSMREFLGSSYVRVDVQLWAPCRM